MADHKPMMDGGCGDPALSQELRDALTLYRASNRATQPGPSPRPHQAAAKAAVE